MLHQNVDARAVLSQLANAVPIQNLGVRIGREHLHNGVCQLVLLALQTERMPRMIREKPEIERRCNAGAAVSILDLTYDEPLRQEAFRNADFVEHVERGRMEGARAQVLGEFSLCLKDRDWKSSARKAQRRCAPDRPCARNEDSAVHDFDSAPAGFKRGGSRHPAAVDDEVCPSHEGRIA
jgi:hypothetical protein